jgi:hypothetical protein
VADDGNRPTCTTEQNFMYTALTGEFLWGVENQWGPRAQLSATRRTLWTMADQYYEVMMPHRPGSAAIDVNGTWAKLLQCTFDAQGALTSCVGTQGSEPSWVEERPGHLSSLLIGDARRATPSRCSVAARALSESLANDQWGPWTAPASGAGWHKGASQAMAGVVYGVGLAEACDPD